MQKTDMILLTGAAGFIGSYLLGYLNREGYHRVIIADDFSRTDKEPNYIGKQYLARVERDRLFEWLEAEKPPVRFVFHLGARTDTTEFDYSVHERLNLDYSKKIWTYCRDHRIPLVYASSAATYGSGEQGYRDDHESPFRLQPLNPYGVSKNEFDKWLIDQTGAADPARPFWAGLKFFNVYGPNEYHKGRMASVIFHAFRQIKESGKVKLFRSHKPGYADGQQLRDFIYVDDVARICVWLMEHRVDPGLYNVGTGRARSFEDLAKATFAGLDMAPKIEYIDMPEDIREKYQYFTEADMSKLKAAGYEAPFHSLEEGVEDYVRNFLRKGLYF